MATIYPKEFFNQPKISIQRASCFGLMPYEQKYREVFDILNQSLESESLKIECNHAEDFHQPKIIEKIHKGITRSEFGIADLAVKAYVCHKA